MNTYEIIHCSDGMELFREVIRANSFRLHEDWPSPIVMFYCGEIPSETVACKSDGESE